MKSPGSTWRCSSPGRLLGFALLAIVAAAAISQPPEARSASPPVILTVEGTNVFVQRFRSNQWESAFPNQVLAEKDRGRTGLRSRTSVRLSDLSVLRVGELSEFEIQPLPGEKVEAEFSLFRGLLYLLNRDRPGKHRFVTPTATAATRGTEFNLEVDPGTGRTLLTVLEGEAELSNAAGTIRIASGEQGLALLGQAPTKTAVIDTTNVVQWCLYYPAVLDVDELNLTAAEQEPISDSLAAYRSGDLLRAVSSYPATRVPASDAERVYVAALLLAVGQVSQAEAILDALDSSANSAPRELGDALRVVIAVVNRRNIEEGEQAAVPTNWRTATALLAESYRLQSGFQIEKALIASRRATEISPKFSFAWVRVAELEFSGGNSTRAMGALETGLDLGPRNAQAVALKGFLLASQNRTRAAEDLFDRAIVLDGGLGNAWLGRGLCRIRRGRADQGRLDLQIAAMTEPSRSLLRSYLGKAFSNAGDHRHAEKELLLARQIDAGDPTPWLYSALLLQQANRINEGVLDLQRSQDLNDNRQVYRSRLLIDQDRAVRGANLANLYRDAGMKEVSAREAGRAVSSDYANYSAHQFLADSFNELRDPRQVNLRYETAWFTEYLVANLLAPIGAGNLSQTVSQQEYSKLFERDRLGIVSATEYFSHGEWRQSAAQFGTSGRSSYAVEMGYHSDNGWRPNNELEEWSLAVNLKHQLSARDSVFVRLNFTDLTTGDPNQYYQPAEANLGLRIHERNEPVLLAGYHHEWSPGLHTLILAGRARNDYRVRNQSHSTFFLNRFAGGPISAVAPVSYEQDYGSEFELYTFEPQQVWQRGDHTFVAGGRYQFGDFQTRDRETDGELYTGAPISFSPASPRRKSSFERGSVYAYDQWQIWPTLLLAGGVSYDHVLFPENHRYGLTASGTESREQVSPKAGFVFTPWTNTTVRGAYFRGLGGVSLDQSYRLEPSQVAGFNQAFRSIIPESVGGANAAPVFDGWALSLEQRLSGRTFLALDGEILSSSVDRRLGVVDFQIPTGPGSPPPFSVRQLREELDYRERTFRATLNHLLSDEWSLGASYRISKADFEDRFPEIPATAGLAGGVQRERDLEAVLHQVQLSVLFNHASGLFAGASAIWNRQSNQGYTPDRPGDDFWQFNVEGGWRFLRRRLEVRTGLLNITDQNYRLNPLNLTAELPRGREMFVSLRFNF